MFNPVIASGVLGWFIAQLVKTLLHAIKTDKINYKRLVGAGGMPSSHTALVLASLINVGRINGVDSSVFGVAFILTVVVIYDAMSVRRAAGLHAKELNILNNIIFKNKPNDEDTQRKRKELNEFLGHTPIEVIGGAVVGVIAAFLIPIN